MLEKSGKNGKKNPCAVRRLIKVDRLFLHLATIDSNNSLCFLLVALIGISFLEFIIRGGPEKRNRASPSLNRTIFGFETPARFVYLCPFYLPLRSDSSTVYTLRCVLCSLDRRIAFIRPVRGARSSFRPGAE